jgi:hypothetical protein
MRAHWNASTLDVPELLCGKVNVPFVWPRAQPYLVWSTSKFIADVQSLVGVVLCSLPALEEQSQIKERGSGPLAFRILSLPEVKALVCEKRIYMQI